MRTHYLRKGWIEIGEDEERRPLWVPIGIVAAIVTAAIVTRVNKEIYSQPIITKETIATYSQPVEFDHARGMVGSIKNAVWLTKGEHVKIMREGDKTLCVVTPDQRPQDACLTVDKGNVDR